MTAQISDNFVFRGQNFSLAGVRHSAQENAGKPLFDPTEHGMTPISMCSACWRGYWCKFLLKDDSLKLQEFKVGLEDAKSAPVLFGRNPETASSMVGNIAYRQLDHIVDFSGGLLLGNDFIQSMYVHMGFHPAYKYETVFELVYEHGKLVEQFDRSEKMASFREMLKDAELKPGLDAGEEKIRSWIKQCFSLDYTSID